MVKQVGAPEVQGKKELSPKELTDQRLDQLKKQLESHLGKSGRTLDSLGPLAAQFLEQVGGDILALASKGGAAALLNVTSSAYKQLLALDKKDQFAARPPADLQGKETRVDSQKLRISETGEKGRFKLAGLSENHLLMVAFKELGIDPNNFGESVKKVVDDAGTRKKDLGSAQGWADVVGSMLMAALGQGGGVKEKLAAATVAGIQTGAKTVLTGNGSATNNGAGLGLERNAPKTSGTGSTSGAFAVRAALLAGRTNQEERVERTAGLVLREAFKAIGHEPADKKLKAQLHADIKEILLDKSSADGKADPFKQLQKAVDAVVKADPSAAPLSDLVGFMAKAFADNPEATKNEVFSGAFTGLTTQLLLDLVSLKTGQTVPGEGKLAEKLQPALQELVAKLEPKAATETGPKPKVDHTRLSGERSDIPDNFKQDALKMLMAYGMDVSHPKSRELTHALAEVLQASTDPQTGKTSPADFVVNIHLWLAQYAGESEVVAQSLAQQVSRMMKGLGRLGEQYQALKSEYTKLQAEQNQASQNGVAYEPRLTELTNTLASLDKRLEKETGEFNKFMTQLQQDGLRKMFAFVLDGTSPSATGSVPNPNSGGGGDKVPPGGNGGNGGVPPGDDKPFRRQEPSGMGAIPGFNAGMRPEDEFGKNLSVQQQRAIKCGEILADPSLSIEDKIFLFMMWFVAFTDQEREKKLEDLVQMDRDTARMKKTKDEKQSEVNSLRSSRKTDEGKLVQAEVHCQKLEKDPNASPEDLAKARGAVEQAKTNLGQRDEAIKMAERDLSDLRVQQDQAPKSREVLFMEIERLNQLRDKIMNMARSILENSNRNIEKIFR